MHVCSRNCVVVLHVYCSIYRKMIAAAWVWAANTKNLRRNAIHGEEEAKLVLNEKFEAADITAQEIQMRGEIDVEDPIAPNVHACVCVYICMLYTIYIYLSLSLCICTCDNIQGHR